MLEWVLCNNCNCYLVFFLHFWTILTIRRYARSLKVRNKVPSKKFQTSLPSKISDESCWKSRTEFCFFGWREPEISTISSGLKYSLPGLRSSSLQSPRLYETIIFLPFGLPLLGFHSRVTYSSHHFILLIFQSFHLLLQNGCVLQLQALFLCVSPVSSVFDSAAPTLDLYDLVFAQSAFWEYCEEYAPQDRCQTRRSNFEP